MFLRKPTICWMIKWLWILFFLKQYLFVDAKSAWLLNFIFKGWWTVHHTATAKYLHCNLKVCAKNNTFWDSNKEKRENIVQLFTFAVHLWSFETPLNDAQTPETCNPSQLWQTPILSLELASLHLTEPLIRTCNVKNLNPMCSVWWRT